MQSLGKKNSLYNDQWKCIKLVLFYPTHHKAIAFDLSTIRMKQLYLFVYENKLMKESLYMTVDVFFDWFYKQKSNLNSRITFNLHFKLFKLFIFFRNNAKFCKWILLSWTVVTMFLTMAFNCNLRACLVQMEFEDPVGMILFCQISLI